MTHVPLGDLLNLSPHGTDTFVGTGPQYPWGGLYGGQIVAQALKAAATTVPKELVAHSLRAYFIRRGDHTEPVRYEVDRIRNGRSFATRRVVARQATGAILNLEASFQLAEASPEIEGVRAEYELPAASEIKSSSWTPTFERSFVPPDQMGEPPRVGLGRAAAWLRVSEPLAEDPLTHQAALAFLSDDLPTDAVVRAHPLGTETDEVREQAMFSASLDHTIWFHRPVRADRWHLHDFACHTFVGGRGLTIGHIFDQGGTHVATVAQEVLLRDKRSAH